VDKERRAVIAEIQRISEKEKQKRFKVKSVNSIIFIVISPFLVIPCAGIEEAHGVCRGLDVPHKRRLF